MVILELTRGMMGYPNATNGIIKIIIDNDSTLEDVLVKAGIDLREVGIVLRNKNKIDLQEKVKDGDKLQVLPVISGG